VRHTLGLEFTGQAEPNDWMLADVHIDGPLAYDEVSIFWGPKGVLAFFPITPHRVRMIADLGLAKDRAFHAELSLAEAQAKVDERGPAGLALSDPIWLSNFRINERKVSEYRMGRAMLAGDAAHIHSPAGGQGMNTGMQDAFNLAWKLALVERGRAKAEPLLKSYTIERSAVGDQVLANAARFTTLATLRNPVAQWLRNHIAPILGSLPMVQDKIRNDWFELSINYRHSPLAVDHWPRLTGGIPAGDRMCDAALTSTDDGRATTLFDAMRGTRHTLLLLPGDEGPTSAGPLIKIADDAARAFPDMLATHLFLRPGTTVPTAVGDAAVWFDTTHRLHEKLHATVPTLVVVRPDGYVGYRCQPADGNGLGEYLGRYLVGR
jgi:hypothetical protein